MILNFVSYSYNNIIMKVVLLIIKGVLLIMNKTNNNENDKINGEIEYLLSNIIIVIMFQYQLTFKGYIYIAPLSKVNSPKVPRIII